MDGRMDRWTDGPMDGWMDGKMDGWMEGWMDGQINRQIDGGIDGEIDGEMNIYIPRYIGKEGDERRENTGYYKKEVHECVPTF